MANGTIEFPMKLYGISLKMLEIEITAKAEIEFFEHRLATSEIIRGETSGEGFSRNKW